MENKIVAPLYEAMIRETKPKQTNQKLDKKILYGFATMSPEYVLRSNFWSSILIWNPLLSKKRNAQPYLIARKPHQMWISMKILFMYENQFWFSHCQGQLLTYLFHKIGIISAKHCPIQ